MVRRVRGMKSALLDLRSRAHSLYNNFTVNSALLTLTQSTYKSMYAMYA